MNIRTVTSDPDSAPPPLRSKIGVTYGSNTIAEVVYDTKNEGVGWTTHASIYRTQTGQFTHPTTAQPREVDTLEEAVEGATEFVKHELASMSIYAEAGDA